MTTKIAMKHLHFERMVTWEWLGQVWHGDGAIGWHEAVPVTDGVRALVAGANKKGIELITLSEQESLLLSQSPTKRWTSETSKPPPFGELIRIGKGEYAIRRALLPLLEGHRIAGFVNRGVPTLARYPGRSKSPDLIMACLLPECIPTYWPRKPLAGKTK